MATVTDFEHGQIIFADGYECFYRYWPGQRGAVLYLHGIQSHGLWFEGSASRLAEAGYAVLLPDRRGSGRNRRDRGDDPGGHWLADLGELCAVLKRRASASRIHLVGVSWGGKLATVFGRHRSDLLASLTLVAPGIYPLVDVSLWDKMAIALCGLGAPRRQFPIPLNEPELFTDNPQRQEFIRADANRLTTVTSRFLCRSHFLDRHARVFDQRFTFPVKLFLAGRDRIIDNRSTLELFRSWHAPRKQLRYYPHASHTLEFESNPETHFDDLVEWIDYVAS